jgi:small subunit ribosomal protein S17
MRRTLIGTVTRDKTAKTRRVEVARQYAHPKYGKIVHDRTVCHVHDERNESRAGDEVEIVESRPRSRLKRWELVRVVRAASGAEVAAAANPVDQPEGAAREEQS